MITDQELLDDYNTTGSAAAFAELMTRHRAHVHSAASRQTRGNTPLAEDVAQTVFCDLARKAGSIRGETLGAWLHGATCLAAKQAMRTEHRRMHRETEAFAANPLTSFDPSTEWDYTAASLGESLNRLRQEDRAAILLRFYEGRSLIEVGTALGTSEIAARKRIQRALKRLRSLLARQGVNTSAVALAGTLSAHAAQTVVIAPTLASSLSGLPAKTAAPRSAWASFKMLLAGKTKAASVAALLAAGAVAPLVLAQKPSAEAGPGIASTGEDRAQAFRDFIAHPPWIKKIVFRRSGNYYPMFVGDEKKPTLLDLFAAYDAAIQPNGYYCKALSNGSLYAKPTRVPGSNDWIYIYKNPERGYEQMGGASADFYWDIEDERSIVAGTVKRHRERLSFSPKNGPGASSQNIDELRSHYFKNILGGVRRLGMDILAEATLSWKDGDHFAGNSPNGPVTGEITLYEQGLPATIRYACGPVARERHFEVHFYYLKDLGPWLPSECVTTEIGGNGLLYTNYIDELNVGVDDSHTEGYKPSEFTLAYAAVETLIESSNAVRLITPQGGPTTTIDETPPPPLPGGTSQSAASRRWSAAFLLCLAATIFLVRTISGRATARPQKKHKTKHQ